MLWFLPSLFNFCSLFLFFTVAPSQSPSLPHSNSSFQGGSTPGIFSFSPANMINAVKQKSAFAPVMRPGPGYSPPMASTLPSGWAQTMLNVSILIFKLTCAKWIFKCRGLQMLYFQFKFSFFQYVIYISKSTMKIGRPWRRTFLPIILLCCICHHNLYPLDMQAVFLLYFNCFSLCM